jgi:hypothetical protein
MEALRRAVILQPSMRSNRSGKFKLKLKQQNYFFGENISELFFTSALIPWKKIE